VKGRTGTGCGW